MRDFCEKQQVEAVDSLNNRRPPNDIRSHCADQWPRNYVMRDFCEKQQVEAVDSVNSGRPPNDIRSHCADQWPRNYVMRDFCEKQQVEARSEERRVGTRWSTE